MTPAPYAQQIIARVPWIEYGAEEHLDINLDGEPLRSRRFRVECQQGTLLPHLGDTAPLSRTAPSVHRDADTTYSEPEPLSYRSVGTSIFGRHSLESADGSECSIDGGSERSQPSFESYDAT